MRKFAKGVLKRLLRGLGYTVTRIQYTEPNTYPFKDIPYNPNAVELSAYARNYSADSLSKRRLYNIGAGSFRHQYWTNIDLISDWYSDQQKDGNECLINFDLFSLGRLPVEDGVAEVVYTSHTVEHINDPASQNMMREAYRILKKGGVFRMTTPDTDLHYEAWRKADKDFFYWIDLYSHPLVLERCKIKRPFNTASLGQIFLFNIATQLSELSAEETMPKIGDAELNQLFADRPYETALDECTNRCSVEVQRRFPGYHMNWWTEKKAVQMLKSAGFTRVYKSGYGQSAVAVLRDVTLFDKQDPKISLYVEAVKE